MKVDITNQLKLVYREKYRDESDIIKSLYSKISKMTKLWGCYKKKSINIYILKSSNKFLFYAFPFYKKIFLILIYPYWYFKTKNIFSWGWLSYKRKGTHYIAIKPIELIDQINRNKLLYKKFYNDKEVFKFNVCNSIINIFISPYSLPIWLKEGINMYITEKILSYSIVKDDTLLLIKRNINIEVKSVNLDNRKNNNELLAYNYAKGYWIVKYLEEEHQGFLKEVLKKMKGKAIVDMIGKKMNLEISDRNQLWRQMDELLYDKYKYLIED